jgi:hypothetical protein
MCVLARSCVSVSKEANSFSFSFSFSYSFSSAWPLAGRVGISAHPLPSGRRHRDAHTVIVHNPDNTEPHQRQQPHISVVEIGGDEG